MTVYITPFNTEGEMLVFLENIGLAKEGIIDTSKVDVFLIWEKKKGKINLPDGTKATGFFDDNSKDPKWAVNLAINECPEELIEYQIFPETPDRVFLE